jgi:hypothetical protein
VIDALGNSSLVFGEGPDPNPSPSPSPSPNNPILAQPPAPTLAPTLAPAHLGEGSDLLWALTLTLTLTLT